MEKMILSLKNLYMVLMTEDFPIYSESVIGRTDRKGQTMLRFWQNQIVEEFRCLPWGKVIWRNDGKRNRYTSYLCNRSAELKTVSEYAKELASQISVSALLNQIDRFAVFLSNRKYRHDVLMRRIQELVRLAEIDDPHFSGQIARQIREAAAPPAWARNESQGDLFHASYLLTLMMLYAAAGNAMDSPALSVLQDRAYCVDALWSAHMRRDEGDSPVSFLTVHAGPLQDNPLPSHRFFGREEELFNLREISATSRKCLISGIGGIGKTELLRQLIRRCVEEKCVDKLAVVPYESSISESFARSFPGFQSQNPEDSFEKILRQLEQESRQHRILVLIDNLTDGVQEDPALKRLLSLDCGIIVTSRRNTLEGFEVCRLTNPTAATGALIFRDNRGRPLSEEDRTVLAEMLSDEALCHPLTLRLMARAARGKNWSVQELREQMRKNGDSLSWQEEERTVRLSRMYRQLYSFMRIPEECQGVAELFTLLPRGSYSQNFLEDTFPDTLSQDGSLTDRLEALVAGGWLNVDDSGYSIHPFVAQCLRRKTITEARIQPVLGDLRRWLPEPVAHGQTAAYTSKTLRSSEILLHISEFLTGSISRGLMQDILTAVNLQILPRRGKERVHRRLVQLMKQCPERDDLTQIMFCTISTNWKMASAEQSLEVFQRQKERLSVPKNVFLDFCLCAGANMIQLRQSEAAEQMLKEVLCGDATALQVATAYFHLTGHSQILGNAEAAIDWAERGVEYVTGHPECGDTASFFNISMLCGLYIKYDRQEAAGALLEKLGTYMRKEIIPVQKIKYLNLMGLYEQRYGSQEQALSWLRQQSELTLEYYGKDRNYYALQDSIGQTLQKLKRYEESESHYTAARDYARQAGDVSLLQQTSNNLATLYLDMDRPSEALDQVETAVAEGRKLGGLMLGDALHNQARTWKMLGDAEAELACLTEAVPLLETACGPAHPKAEAARRRLAQLAPESGTGPRNAAGS